MSPEISLLVPVHNEAKNVQPFYHAASQVLDGLAPSWEIVFVNDGSQDDTATRIVTLGRSDRRVKLVDLTRNFGKEVAVSAGLQYASGGVVIGMDGDLQHPPQVIEDLLAKWREGYKVVFAVRRSRGDEPLVRRLLSAAFYRVFGRLAKLDGANATSDFCLLPPPVVVSLRALGERDRFTRGLIAWLGYPQAVVPYDVAVRHSGSSKWNYWRLWNHALQGITSFSSAPLKLWTYVGLVIATLSVTYAAVIVLRTLILGIEVPGYASLMTGILFIGGVQLISLGILGEYISRIYGEVKGRPLYVVSRTFGLPPSPELERAYSNEGRSKARESAGAEDLGRSDRVAGSRATGLSSHT